MEKTVRTILVQRKRIYRCSVYRIVSSGTGLNLSFRVGQIKFGSRIHAKQLDRNK